MKLVIVAKATEYSKGRKQIKDYPGKPKERIASLLSPDGRQELEPPIIELELKGGLPVEATVHWAYGDVSGDFQFPDEFPKKGKKLKLIIPPQISPVDVEIKCFITVPKDKIPAGEIELREFEEEAVIAESSIFIHADKGKRKEEILDFRTRWGKNYHDPYHFSLCRLENYNKENNDSVQIGIPENAVDVYVEAQIQAADLGGNWKWQGRWIVDCPTCSGQEYTCPDYPYFMCNGGCWNRDYNNQWLKVKFPKNKKALEDVLLLRPGENRNWHKDETVAQLKQENLDHDMPIPE